MQIEGKQGTGNANKRVRSGKKHFLALFIQKKVVCCKALGI